MAIALAFGAGILTGATLVYWILDHLCDIEVKVFQKNE